MVRVLVIQQLYNLSDEQMEFQLLDRLSFQRFVGLRQSSQAPERTTIWTFKERLIKAGATERIFEAVSQQLNRQGDIARGGHVQARWTKKHGKSDCGYKLSTSVDRRHKLVRKIHISTASEHDTLCGRTGPRL
jgi:IS5 family transposase